MKTVAIKDAKNRLSELVREAEAGETIVLTRNGVPVADIAPHTPKKGGLDFEKLERTKKELGIDKVFTYVAPDFDDPLPEDFLITPERE